MTQIANDLQISAAYASVLIEDPVREGALVRAKGKGDRRKCLITLSPVADQIIHPIERVVLAPLMAIVDAIRTKQRTLQSP